MSGYQYGQNGPRYTYLVGPEDSFLHYLRKHGVKEGDLFVRRVSTMSGAKELTPEDSVGFLHLWETLPEAKRIARHCAYLRAVRSDALL